MILWFISSLLLTFLVVRIGAHRLHDRENFGTLNEKSKTITFWIRKKLNKDIHHIHIGVLILLIILPIILLTSLTRYSTILLGISLSLISDQLISLIDRSRNYFHIRSIIESLIAHIIIIVIAILLF